jgi:putative sterol carrier protein
MSHKATLNAELDQVTPEVFFEHIVPAVLTATARQRESSSFGGRFELAVLDRGHKSWTIDLDEGRVHVGSVGKTDCYVEMSQQDFDDMMHDRLDVEAAVRAGRVRFSGKAPVLAHFAAIMRPSNVGY